LAIAFAFAPSLAIAGAADAYVKGLVGKWRGGGTVLVNDKGKKIKLRCSTVNTLNDAKRELTMKGRCASSQGTRPLRGRIKYSADGNSIASVSLKLAGRGGRTSGNLSGKTLTLSGSAKNDDGIVENTRTVISGGGSRYKISLNAKGAKGWQNRGILSFKR